jgi:Flp pilus assembly protein TadG
MRVMVRLREEGGANAVIVAILLVVLLGMLSLSVDGGFLFLKFRAMRNANDAAALAAALSCAKGEGLAAANGQADALAADNVADALRVTDPVYTPSCAPAAGKVMVHYKGQQSLFFSQVVGVSSPKTVSATATATWGKAGGASNVSPLMLNMNRLSSCNIPDGPGLVPGVTKCTFFWNNGQLGNAAWGLMNLQQWNVQPAANCSNAGQTSYASWLQYGFPGALVLNNPPPTYVCRDSGFFGGALDNDIQQAIATGNPYAFPVNDSSKQLDKNGVLCPAPSCTSPDKYDVVGFAWLKLVDLCVGTGGGRWRCGSLLSLPLCQAYQADSNSRCLVTEWEGFTTNGLYGNGGGSFGNLIAVALTG